MTKRLIARILSLALLLLVSGCAGHRGARTTYHDPNMDFGLIQSVAVLPFENLSPAARAGESVREVFSTTLQASGAVYVHPPGEVRRAIVRVNPQDPKSPTPEEVVELAQNIGADVVITGVVLEYGQIRSSAASANVCSVSLKMIEGQTGRVVWSASATTGGVGASERLLGGGGQPMNIVVSQAVQDLLNRLFEGV